MPVGNAILFKSKMLVLLLCCGLVYRVIYNRYIPV